MGNETIQLNNPKEKSDNLLNFKLRNTPYYYNNKVVSFVDLAGHEKYLKTTIFGVTGLFPDYGIVVISANTGITKLTREHLGILLYLNIPFIIVITKIDLAPRQVYQNLCNQLKKLLGRNTFGRVLYFISDSEKKNDETDHYMSNMLGYPDIIPVISASNKDGTNIDNLHRILYSLPPRNKWNNVEKHVEGSIYYIDSVFIVPGIGMVVSGTNKGNSIKLKQKMFIGPFSRKTKVFPDKVAEEKSYSSSGPFDGMFKEVTIRSIHNSLRQNVEEAVNGVQSCLNIKLTNQKETLDRNMIKKGMVIIDNIDKYKSNITSQFIAKINVLHHSSTIKTGYTPVIHCGPIRQAASLELEDNENILRSGDNKIVKFIFKYHPEFIEEDMIFFFRDGTTKGVGKVISIKNV
jgi:GTPase